MKEYIHVEIGRISETESLLLMYAENGGYPTETIYAFVPVEEVEEIIKKHGGLVKHWKKISGTEGAKIGTLTAENGTLKKEIEAKSEETKRTDWKKNFLNRFLRKY